MELPEVSVSKSLASEQITDSVPVSSLASEQITDSVPATAVLPLFKSWGPYTIKWHTISNTTISRFVNDYWHETITTSLVASLYV